MARYSSERLAKQRAGIERAKKAGKGRSGKGLGRPLKADPLKVRQRWDELGMDALWDSLPRKKSWRIEYPQYWRPGITRRWDGSLAEPKYIFVGYEIDNSTEAYAAYRKNFDLILKEFGISHDLLYKYLAQGKTKKQAEVPPCLEPDEIEPTANEENFFPDGRPRFFGRRGHV
jgi:hypothetical protein